MKYVQLKTLHNDDGLANIKQNEIKKSNGYVYGGPLVSYHLQL